MNQLLSFDKMITPVIIKILFWVGVVVSIFTGFILIATAFTYNGSGLLQVISGLFVAAIGVLMSRVYCELLIIFFKMNESLTDIKSLLIQQNMEKKL